MKKALISSICMLIVSCGLSQDTSKNINGDTSKIVNKLQFTCSMHPEITSDKPGVCPKCGMQLVEKSKTSGADKMKIMHPKMMDGMSDASHKKGFPKMLLMGAVMGVAAIIMMVSRH